jgi:hypothetical protein
MVHDTACAGTADKTILAPTIHIPSSHPGHQTKNHPARKAGNISSRFFEVGDGIFFTAEGAEDRRGKRQRTESFTATNWRTV